MHTQLSYYVIMTYLNVTELLAQLVRGAGDEGEFRINVNMTQYPGMV